MSDLMGGSDTRQKGLRTQSVLYTLDIEWRYHE